MTVSTPQVRIVEVSPRDGLQNIREEIPTTTKLELIRRLREAGLGSIELTSVVSPRIIPQLADCREILSHPSVKSSTTGPRLPVLVPNIKGLNIATEYGVKEVAVFISATEGFSKANTNCSVQQGIERAQEVAKVAQKAGIAVRGYVSCVFADPYDGPTPKAAVLSCVKSLLDAGCYEISLGDTLGVGSPSNVRNLIQYLINNGVSVDRLAGHFHDTYGQAVANVWEAYTCGLRVFDSSVGGLGGCPFAPGAKGNVASEDLVYMFHNAGISTGVDLAKLIQAGEWISQQLSMPNSSRAVWMLGRIKIFFDSQKLPAAERFLHQSGIMPPALLARQGNGTLLTKSRPDVFISAPGLASSSLHTLDEITIANGRFFYTAMGLGQWSIPMIRHKPATFDDLKRLNFEDVQHPAKGQLDGAIRAS